MMQMLWWMTRLLLFAAGMMTAPVLAQDVTGPTPAEQSRDSASAEIVDHSKPQQSGQPMATKLVTLLMNVSYLERSAMA